MKKLNITKEQFNRSRYFQKKYGTLEYVSESGKVFKTSKGKLLKFNEDITYGLTNDEVQDKINRELEKRKYGVCMYFTDYNDEDYSNHEVFGPDLHDCELYDSKEQALPKMKELVLDVTRQLFNGNYNSDNKDLQWILKDYFSEGFKIEYDGKKYVYIINKDETAELWCGVGDGVFVDGDCRNWGM